MLPCPITGEPLDDPVVVAESGNTYSRWAITEWFESCRVDNRPYTDPLTNVIIADPKLISNHIVNNLVIPGDPIDNRDMFEVRLSKLEFPTTITDLRSTIRTIVRHTPESCEDHILNILEAGTGPVLPHRLEIALAAIDRLVIKTVPKNHFWSISPPTLTGETPP